MRTVIAALALLLFAPAAQAGQPDLNAVIVQGQPPLTMGTVLAHVAINEFQLQLLLGDYDMQLDVPTREALAKQLMAAYPQLPLATRQQLTRLPAVYNEMQRLWKSLDGAHRDQAAATFRQRWQAQAQAASQRWSKAQRASYQAWSQAAAATRSGDTTRAERILAQRMANDARFSASLERAKQRRAQTRGSGAGGKWTKADTRRHLRASMTYHYVQTNMANMTTNMFLTGSP